jgi:serine/threonine protein phosphatase PrpC
MIIVESAGISDIGKKRNQNEDALFFDDTMGLYVVADGMGGHLAGEVASRLVVETMRDYIQHQNENEQPENPIDGDGNLSREAKHLLSSIRLSNQLVHQASLKNESYRGMGSTVSAVYFTNNTFIVANVGDSPIYLIRNGRITLLSVPHTVFAEQTARDPESAELLDSKFKHILTRAMGVDKSVQTHIHETPCYRNDILVISSDGLSDKASPKEILQVVEFNSSDKACQELVDLANERGGDDNVTAIVLKVRYVQNTHRRFMDFLTFMKRLNLKEQIKKKVFQNADRNVKI